MVWRNWRSIQNNITIVDFSFIALNVTVGSPVLSFCWTVCWLLLLPGKITSVGSRWNGEIWFALILSYIRIYCVDDSIYQTPVTGSASFPLTMKSGNRMEKTQPLKIKITIIFTAIITSNDFKVKLSLLNALRFWESSIFFCRTWWRTN